MGDKVVMNGACTCPGDKEENPTDSTTCECPGNKVENPSGTDTCACPDNQVDDGTGTDNCVGKQLEQLVLKDFLCTH